jgi:oxygen-dependent protoporphyrinogen oxidase
MGMLGTLNANSKEVLILGGGFSGLLSAWHLAHLGWKVDLVEGNDRLGGLISTQADELGLTEAAAHSFLVTESVRDFCEQLKVPLVSIRKNSRSRYIVRNGKPRRFPLRWFELLDLVGSVLSKRADANHSDQADDLTVQQWADYYLGKPALEYLLNPMIRGIYAARPSELEVRTAFPKLNLSEGESVFALPRKRKSRTPSSGGRAQMMAPAFGMQSIIDAMIRDLRANPSVTLRTQMKVSSLEDFQGPNLIVTLPAYSLSRIFAVDSQLEEASACARVNYAPLISVTAFVKTAAFDRLPRGVGTLVPEFEELNGWKALGVLYNSASFPNRVKDESKIASFTLMFGGTAHPEHFSWDEDELRSEVIKTLERIFDSDRVGQNLIAIKAQRWGQAIPVHDRELRVARETLARTFCAKPGRVVFGNWTGEVSLRGMMETWSALRNSLT